MVRIILSLSLLISAQLTRAEEYLYPVGVLETDDASWIYVIHQKSFTHIELWQWNPETHQTAKALLSTFMPAGLKVMPNNAGISFIDQGRIRIKKFIKRSPKALEIYEPLYDIASFSWLDENTAYFSATEHARHGIYQVDLQSNVHCIRSSLMADCSYPAKVESSLFYIERSREVPYRYALACGPYPTIPYNAEPSFNDSSHFAVRSAQIMQESDQESEHSKSILSDEQRSLLISFGEKPVAFLTMLSSTKGFCIEYPGSINRSAEHISFICHLIEKTENQWQYKKIFSFKLPTSLIVPSETSLYESIAPLLPRYRNDALFFSDLNDVGHLHLKSYNLQTHACVTVSSGVCDFSPCYLKGKLYFGCISNQGPQMQHNEDDGEVIINIPYIPCNEQFF